MIFGCKIVLSFVLVGAAIAKLIDPAGGSEFSGVGLTTISAIEILLAVGLWCRLSVASSIGCILFFGLGAWLARYASNEPCNCFGASFVLDRDSHTVLALSCAAIACFHLHLEFQLILRRLNTNAA